MEKRTTRINALLKREISELLHTAYQDQTIYITITAVATSPDLRQARVGYSVLGGASQRESATSFFSRNRTEIRRKVGKKVVLKYLPRFQFILDESIERGMRLIEQIEQMEAEEKISLAYTEIKPLLLGLSELSVVVIGHMRPDGDCIGSQIALCRVLNALGARAIAVNADSIPGRLQGFIADTPFIAGEPFAGDAEIAITVDCADPSRIGDRLRVQFPSIFLNIDHHLSNPHYGEKNLICPKACATGEILANVLLDGDLPVDAVTAQALYIAIATDTVQFRFSSTNATVFERCQQLCTYGADPAAASLLLYEQEPLRKLKLLQCFLGTLELVCEARVCIGHLRRTMFEATGAQPEDAEGFVDYARSVSNVAIGALLEEQEGTLKASLRTKEPKYRVDCLAQQFGGGGHACAAGLNVRETWDSFYPRFIQALETHLNHYG